MRLCADANGAVVVETDRPAVIRRNGREQRVERVRLAVCRCGRSGSKPTCDLTHLQIGFAAPASELRPVHPPTDARRRNDVRITSQENGPNKVELEGAVAWKVVRDGREETLERPAIFLCRCGHSQNKPFCDGTHRKIGFEAAGAEIEVVPQP